MIELRAAFDRHRASRRRMFLTALIAPFALGCSDATTSTRNARSMKANMSVAASISSQSATQVLLFAFYLTTPLDTTGLTSEIGNPGGAGPLGTQLVDLQSASSQSVSMSVDLAPCLSDSKISHRGDECPYVYIEAFLLTGQNTIDPNNPGLPGLSATNLLDADIVGPFAVSLSGGGTTPRALLLHEVGSISVSPPSLSLTAGQASNLTATVTDIQGKPVAGRTVTWSSGSNSIATVSSSGQVTAVASGFTTITASTGGRSAIVGVSVSAPRIVLTPSTNVSFVVSRGSITTTTPSSAAIAVASSAGTTAPIALTAPTTTYGTSGVNWLNVSLSTSTTPATLSIVPINTANLPNGIYFATITVRSTNTSIASSAISVTLTVTTSATGSITVSNIGRP